MLLDPKVGKNRESNGATKEKVDREDGLLFEAKY